MTLIQLAETIRKFPEEKKALIISYRAKSNQTYNFIRSLINLDAEIIARQLECYAQSVKDDHPRTVREMFFFGLKQRMFDVKETGKTYVLSGVLDGEFIVSELTSGELSKIDGETEIQYLF